MSDTPGWSAPDGSQPEPPAQPYGASPPPGYGPPPAYGAAPPPAYGAAPPPAYGSPPPPPYGAAPGYGTPPPSFGAYGSPPPSWTPKPGVIPLRPLGVGELLDGALTAVRSNWRVMIGAAAVVSIGSGLLDFGLSQLTRNVRNQNVLTTLNGSSDYYSASASYDVAQLGVSLLVIVIRTLAIFLLIGFATSVVSRAVLGQSTSIGQAWQQVRPHLLKLVGLTLLVGLVVSIATVFCVLPGIYATIVFSLAAPALVLERASVTTSMRRSFRLVRGAWWRTFGIALLGYLIIALIGIAIQVPILLAGAGSTGLFSGGLTADSIDSLAIFSALGEMITGTITFPFVAALISLTYIDRRMRSEGLDIELMRAAGYGQSPS